MKKNKIKFFAISIFILQIFSNNIFAAGFSGITGFRADAKFYNEATNKTDVQLDLSAFMAAQMNIGNSLLLRTEMTLKTSDLLSDSLFKDVPSLFRLNELSLIYHTQSATVRNYLSFFAGTYEPFGSDVFLQRQFGIEPIASRIMTSWMGLSGSIIHPLFGFGVADVVRFRFQPSAIGVYVYGNSEIEKSISLNAALRYACAYRFFTMDLSLGVGIPFDMSSDTAFAIIDKIYLHAGLTMLAGNNYTSSLFLQAGVSQWRILKTSNAKDTFTLESIYTLVEPRIKMKDFKIHISAFCLSDDTVPNLLFIKNQFGANIMLGADTTSKKTGRKYSAGINLTATIRNKNFGNIASGSILGDGIDTCASPFFAIQIFSGELNTMLRIEPVTITASGVEINAYANIAKLHIGYKTRL